MKRTYKVILEAEADSFSALHGILADVLESMQHLGVGVLDVKEADFHDVPAEFRKKC